MSLTHHGATRGVTGSCHQLFIDKANSILIDCGLFQGEETSASGSASNNSLGIDFDISTVKALVATHVHIDHVGRIPDLLAAGFDGPIYCSEPSAKLLPIVLEDAFKLSVSRDQTLVERYLHLIEQRIRPLPYKQWHTIIQTPQSQCRIRLQRAGHILGSAYVECELNKQLPNTEHGKPNTTRRVTFSGDLGAPHAPILPAPRAPHRADTLVIESTYGDRNHENRRTRRRRFEQVIEQALQDRGSVLIPAFSIGRTQELLYELEDIQYRRRNDTIQGNLVWKDLPVILDSPLASRFNTVYRSLKPFWDEEALKRVSQGRKPLGFDQLITVDTHPEHLSLVNRLAETAHPAIVIAGSGMCTSGRIVNYLKAMLGDSRHNVLFMGYQAAGTPGRIIQQYGPRGGYVEFDGQRYDIRAGIHIIGGYSAHADQTGLINFVTRMRHWPSEIRIVHGDPGAKQQLKAELEARYQAAGKTADINIPE